MGACWLDRGVRKDRGAGAELGRGFVGGGGYFHSGEMHIVEKFNFETGAAALQIRH